MFSRERFYQGYQGFQGALGRERDWSVNRAVCEEPRSRSEADDPGSVLRFRLRMFLGFSDT